MRTLLLATAVVIAGLGVARAADMGAPVYKAAPPAPVAYSWTSCYGGASGGWGIGDPNFTDASPNNVYSATGANLTGGLFDAGSLQRPVGLHESGGIFGGQIGCDYQFTSNFLVGVSGSFAGADFNGTVIDPYTDARGVNPSNGVISTKTSFLADISGRLGFIWGQTLLYGKGGIAWAHHDYTADTCYCNSDSAMAFSGSNTADGAVAGAGVELALAPNWSAFAEYDHYFFSSQTVNFTSPGIGFIFTAPLTAAVNVKEDIDAFKVGVNYHLK